MASVAPEDRDDYRPSCPGCPEKISIMYSRPLPGASGQYQSTGDCRNCGPVPMSKS